MGIYEFQCPHGHVTELMVRLESRPQHVICKHEQLAGEPGSPICGQTAPYVVSAVKTTFRAVDRKAFKRSGR